MGSIVDGEPVDAAVTNAAKLDRLQDDTAFGIITLANTDPSSGPTVPNTQAAINQTGIDKKLIIRTADDSVLTWSSPFLTFTADLLVFFPDTGFTNRILVANSPINLANDGDSIFFTLNRLANISVIPSVTQPVTESVNTYRFATRIGTNIFFGDNTLLRNGNASRIGESNVPSSGILKVTLFDPVSTSLPSGASPVVDGVSVSNGDTVLFNSLSSGNHEVYKASNIGVSVVWTAQAVFPTGLTPTSGDVALITSGASYAHQIADFSGTDWTVNYAVRFFNLSGDYWELNALQTSALTDNTTGNVFTIAYAGSNNIIVDFSITRGSNAEIGTIHLRTDGTNTVISVSGPYTGTTGVTFFADVLGPNLRLRYTTASTGTNAQMKYFIRRWSDVSGGPGGPASYSPPGPSPTTAGGSPTDIQYNSGGLLAGDPSFTWDNTNKIMQINNEEFKGLQSFSLSNNVVSPTTIFFYNSASYPFSIIEYSVLRNTDYQVGTLTAVTNGTVADIFDANVNTSFTGITFSILQSGANTFLQYTSTNTGFNATFKYSIRRWS